MDMRNLQEQVKKMFWPFTVWINCSSDLKDFANSQPSASNFKSFSHDHKNIFFLTVGQNNFGNKIPFFAIFSGGSKDQMTLNKPMFITVLWQAKATLIGVLCFLSNIWLPKKKLSFQRKNPCFPGMKRLPKFPRDSLYRYKLCDKGG